MTIRAVDGQPGAQVIIISGPSGVGKDTIIDAMKRRHPEHPRRYVITVKVIDIFGNDTTQLLEVKI